jgi:hypothetical protein
MPIGSSALSSGTGRFQQLSWRCGFFAQIFSILDHAYLGISPRVKHDDFSPQTIGLPLLEIVRHSLCT